MQISLKAALLACVLVLPGAITPVLAQDSAPTPAADTAAPTSAPAAPAPAPTADAATPVAPVPGSAAPSASVVTLTGVVTDLFGDRFVLDTGREHILVASRLPLAAGQSIETGDHLTIVGNAGPDGFDATSIKGSKNAELLAALDDLPSGPMGPPPAPDALPAPGAGPAGPAAPGLPVPPPPPAPVAGPLPQPAGSAPLAGQVMPPPPAAGAGPAQPPRAAGPATPGAGMPSAAVPAAGARPPVPVAGVSAPSQDDVVSKLKDMGFSNLTLQRQGPADFQFLATLGGKSDVTVAVGPDQAITQLKPSANDKISLSSIEAALPEGVASALSARGIDTVSGYQATPRAYFIDGYTHEGNRVGLAIGASRRVTTVSVDDPAVPPVQPISLDQARSAAVRQGYRLDGSLSAEGGKFISAAFNPYGEHVIVTLDGDGVVSKEVQQ